MTKIIAKELWREFDVTIPAMVIHVIDLGDEEHLIITPAWTRVDHYERMFIGLNTAD